MRDRRNLSSRQKASLARNSDISVDPYDRRAHDLARTASHDRHLRFIVANIRAAQLAIEISLSGAQISARRVLKRKFMGGISTWNFTVPKQRVNFKFSRLLARRKIPKQRANVVQNSPPSNVA